MKINSLVICATFFASLVASGQLVSNFNRESKPVQAENYFPASMQGKKTNLSPEFSKYSILKDNKMAKVPVDEPLIMNSYTMSRNDSLYFITWGTNVAYAQYTSRVGDIIVGSDGSFYLKDPFLGNRIGTWLKGKLEDNVVSFTLPQAIAYAQYEDGTQTKLLADVIEQQDNTFVPVGGENIVTFIWDNDSLKCVDPNVKIGMVLEDSGAWTGYADWDINMTVQRDVPSTYNGYADALNYSMSGFDYNFMYNQTFASEIKMRFDNDRVILCDIPAAPEGSVVIGSVEGDELSIPQQYLGVDSVNMCHVYFQPLEQHLTLEGSYLYPENKCIDTYKLTLNRDSLSFHAAEDNAFSINCGKNVLLTIDTRGMLHNARFKPFDRNRPATPTTAAIYMYANSNPEWGFACFSHPLMDIEGNYIDPEQTYYRIYMDDELQELDTEVYTGFDTDEKVVTEVPFLFNNSANIFSFNWGYMHQVSTFKEWGKFGIQMVYKAGGVERVSDIFYSDQTIVPASICQINDNDQNVLIESVYYDMSGRKVSNPVRGMYIRCDRYNDGYVNSVKVAL
ncbi:MAG: hypothetical protein HDR84_07715 [Bacteroides sp.]|nr:hypothetical protein [Bacteroides sp.]